MFKRKWVGFRRPKPSILKSQLKHVAKASLAKVAKALTTVPKDFNILKKTDKLLRTREDMFFNQNQVIGAWAQLAFGTHGRVQCKIIWARLSAWYIFTSSLCD